VEANDLVESNVIGGMNSNYAFYMGLMDRRRLRRDLSEDEILSDVWGTGRGQIRSRYRGVGLLLPHARLRSALREDIEAYIALSRTEEGKALNQALFGAFDDLFVDISRRLGEGAARFLVGEDI
jgi:hypothetical protein